MLMAPSLFWWRRIGKHSFLAHSFQTPNVPENKMNKNVSNVKLKSKISKERKYKNL